MDLRGEMKQKTDRGHKTSWGHRGRVFLFPWLGWASELRVWGQREVGRPRKSGALLSRGWDSAPAQCT